MRLRKQLVDKQEFANKKNLTVVRKGRKINQILLYSYRCLDVMEVIKNFSTESQWT